MRTIIHALILTAIQIPSTLLAQDGHYWTQQYGTKSMLLSGSVIAGVEDLGAVYYNPGRLAVIANSAFLLSGNVYEYGSIQIDNYFGDSKNVSKSEIRGVPTLAAGTFKIKKLPRHHFAYAIMTRQSSDLGLSFSGEVNDTDVLLNVPGNEDFGAQVNITQKYLEQWVGLTWSMALDSNISIGVTTNFATNNQTKGNTINLQARSAANEVAQYQYGRGYSYKQNGLLWKVGIAANWEPWQFGLTVTTPLVNLSGSGTYNFQTYLSPITGITQPQYYATNSQEGLDVVHHTPWSVGFGITRSLGRNKIHLSSEWYSGIAKYTMMTAADHYSQSTPVDTIGFILTDNMKSVWNTGIGAEIFISEKVSGFLSFSTDFAALTDNFTRFTSRQNESSNAGFNADFYNSGGGIVLKLKGADITLGATHTGGAQKISRLVSFPDNGAPIFDPNATADFKWERWRFVFSFSLPFLKDYTDKLSGEGKK